MENKKYSVWTGLKKVLIQVAIFGIPLLSHVLPEAWMNLTIGGLLALILNAVKFQLTK